MGQPRLTLADTKSRRWCRQCVLAYRRPLWHSAWQVVHRLARSVQLPRGSDQSADIV